MPFNITQHTLKNDNVECIIVTGDLDNETYQGLEETIKQNIADKKYRILVDFSGVHGFCSAAEFVLIWANREVSSAGGKLVLYCGTPNVFDLMVAFGLNAQLPLYSDIKEAEESFK